jgi:fatty acid desaturase
MSENQSKTVSMGEWVWTLILCAIPGVNIVMAFVWAFGGAKPSKRNLFRAWLLLALAGIVLAGLCWAAATYLLGWAVPWPDFGSLLS